MTQTIFYTYAEDTTERTGQIACDRDEAIARAVDELDAERMEDGRYRYHADEAGRDYAVTADEMAELGAGLLAGHSMGSLYSIWCSSTGEEITDIYAAVRPDPADGARGEIVALARHALDEDAREWFAQLDGRMTHGCSLEVLDLAGGEVPRVGGKGQGISDDGVAELAEGE